MKSTGTDDKPAVDQASLQRLLSAAYVVQQHNERLQAGQPPETGHSQILKEILEVQEQLRSSQLDTQEKMALLARRLREMTRASGSAIGLLKGSRLEYAAATGRAASEAGAEMPEESCLAYECLRTGQLLQVSNTAADSRLNPEVCASLDVKALIGVPVKQEGRTAGILELHFDQPNSFQEQEVRTCQLLAALVTDAILKPLNHPANKAVPAGLGSMGITDTESLLAALEKIRPKLNRLGANRISPNADSPANPTFEGGLAEPEIAAEPGTSTTTECRGCGHAMSADEQFCGLCGSPRQSQHVWSSLLDLQRKAEISARQNGKTTTDAFDDPLDVFPSELEEIVAKFSGEPFEDEDKGEDNHTKASEVALPSFAEELVSPKMKTTTIPDAGARPEAHPLAGQVAEDNEPGAALHKLVHEYQVDEYPVDEHPASGEAGAENELGNAHDAASWSAPDHNPQKAADSGRPFLLEKSSDNAPPPPTELYPSFSGFASDSSLLSLSADTEAENPSRFGKAPPEDDVEKAWEPSESADPGTPSQKSPWGSAVKTKEWLEVQRDQSAWLAKKWQQQRANIYLVASGFLLLVVLLGWAAPSKPTAKHRKLAGSTASTQTTANEDAPEQPELTLSEKLLVSLGLAEAPAAEVANPGNPDTRVWIDVHTALYYCPGTDLYGKTPGGKTATQREAQEDQFQPATRKACN